MKKRPNRIRVKRGTWKSICDGDKTLLVRVDDRIFALFSTDSEVVIMSGDNTCTCCITDIRRYASLEELLTTEDLEKIAHGCEKEAHWYLSHIYRKVPKTHRFIVLELNLLKIGRRHVT